MSKLERAEKALQAKLQEKGWSSDDDSDVDERGDGAAVTKNATPRAAIKEAAGAGKTTKKKLVRDHDASRKRKSKGSSVLYVGHLPRELGEYELKKLFGQFGTVKRVRVARSKRTGGPKGYAFVELGSPDVAAIVADTFSGYLLMGRRRLVCHVVPPDQLNLHRMFAKPIAKKSKSEPPARTLSQMQVITDRLLAREKAKRKKLAELGIEYEFPGYEAGKAPAATSPSDKDGAKASATKQGPSAEEKAVPRSSEKKSRRKDSASSMELEGEEEMETPKSRKKKRKESDASLEKEPDRPDDKHQSSPKDSAVQKSSSEKKASKRKESDSSDQRPSSARKRLESESDGRRENSASPARPRKDSAPTTRGDKESSSAKKHPKVSRHSEGNESSSIVKEDVADPPSPAKESKPKKASKREHTRAASIDDETPTKATREESSTKGGDDDALKNRPMSEKKHKKDKKSKKDKNRRASAP